MASCLGMYVEYNKIKYAKISKNRDTIKVDAYGVEFSDNLEMGIKKVIEETASQKTPISINLENENYEYFNMFSLLNQKDLEKAIKTEFESFCSDKGYNPNVFETRYAAGENTQEKERLRIIHISSNKIEINKKIQQLEGFKVGGIFPVPMTIGNIKPPDEKENAIIVNLEDKTIFTTILNNKIYQVQTIEEGALDFLSKIEAKENSKSKAYEMIKNTTIYTSEGADITEEQAIYLEDIMPVLYTIVGEVKKAINESPEKINRIYLTGTGALINNIDLYFQEYLENVPCEILRPSFIKITPDANVKDYVEVNSAISLALSGLGEGIKGMNFKSNSFPDNLPDFFKIDLNPEKKGKEKKRSNNLLKNDLSQPLDKTEKGLLRVATSLLILFCIYVGFSMILNQQIQKKEEEAKSSISTTKAQMALANSDNEKIKTKTNEYTTLITNLQEINDKISDRNKTKKAIPNLLNSLMFGMPENVQITSIQNTSDHHIEINAQSTKYEQLGFLKAKIKTDQFLTNVISTTGEKNNNIISIKIEGDLP